MRQRLLCLLLGLAVAPVAAEAHHSIAGIYDISQQQRIEGIVAEFLFVNPHPFVVVDVTDRTGGSQRWRLELDNRFELVGIGMTSDTLKRGDSVVVTGSRARDRGHSLYVRRLDRASDGFWYQQVGSSPRIRTSR